MNVVVIHRLLLERCVGNTLGLAEIISTRLSYHRLQRKSNSPKKKVARFFLAAFFVEKSSGSMQWCYSQFIPINIIASKKSRLSPRFNFLQEFTPPLHQIR